LEDDNGGIIAVKKQIILIIDDDSNIRKTLSDILKIKGYEPLTAENGTKGLDLLKQFSVNLAIVDLRLPDIPGLEVLNRIKTNYPSTEIIILTGNASLNSAIEATNKGAFSYLLKPYDVDQLMLHIRRALEKHEAEESLIRIQKAVESSSEAIGMANPQGSHFYHNKAFFDMFGYLVEELNEPLAPIIIYADPEVGREVFETIMQGDPWVGETTMVSKGGRRFPILLRADAVKDSNGNIIGLIGVHTDIAEQKMAEQRLSEEVALKNFLLDLFKKASALTDKELYDHVLNHVVRLTDSTIGFFHLVSDDQKDVILTAWNTEALKNCTALYATHYPIDQAGNWGDCVRLRRPVVYNEFSSSPNLKGFPEEHTPVRRFMSVPVVERGKVRIIFGVGNKSEEYNEFDVDCIQVVANDLQRIMAQRRTEIALNRSEAYFRSLIENSSDVITILNTDGTVLYMSPSLENITGVAPSELINQNIFKYVHPDDVSAATDIFARSIQSPGVILSIELRLRHNDSSWHIYESTVQNLLENEAVKGIVVNSHDITARKRAEEEIITLSITDQLTGLYNRRGFITLSEYQLRVAERTKKNTLLFFADLDKMKYINDTFGHQEGDKALTGVAAILKEVFRESDIIGRMGGDEFAILAIDTTDNTRDILLKRLQETFDNYNIREARNYHLSLSIGIARYDSEKPSTLDKLISQADKLMYEEKGSKQH
jgi:diguanylate cyclase (GGDEF)-like protein/PAS domain S-box-containing protein